MGTRIGPKVEACIAPRKRYLCKEVALCHSDITVKLVSQYKKKIQGKEKILAWAPPTKERAKPREAMGAGQKERTS